MERHNLGRELFRVVNAYCKENGLKLNRGTIVDATIIDAPRSTRNKARQKPNILPTSGVSVIIL